MMLVLCAFVQFWSVLHLAKDCKVVAQWVSHAGAAMTAAGKAWSTIDSDFYSWEWHPLKHQQRGITKGTMGINHQISKYLNSIKPNESNPSFGVDHGSTWGISYNYHQLAILITNMIVNHHMWVTIFWHTQMEIGQAKVKRTWEVRWKWFNMDCLPSNIGYGRQDGGSKRAAEWWWVFLCISYNGR